MTERIHEHIKQIEIKGLWGKSNITWNLNPDVNILSGINGSGKSTIIQCVANMFRKTNVSNEQLQRIDSIVVEFEDGQKVSSLKPIDQSLYNVDVISTFDSTLKELESIQHLSNAEVKTDLDWTLYQLQRKYISYQLAQGKNAIELLMKKAPEDELQKLMERRIQFFDLIDNLFAKSGKHIDRESDELTFLLGTKKISPYKLSSGEKQLLVIMSTVLIENRQPYVLIMDEPEISLHFDWQQVLIESIRDLNPNVQLIMATHSPAMIMNGWMGHVSEISDLEVE